MVKMDHAVKHAKPSKKSETNHKFFLAEKDYFLDQGSQ
uniref:Uncharacterized protein n=1 Tax=Arundo donax TaxID=35708 RepID=A0A0A9BUV2_ARUDO